jgi:hypothetical protein
MRLRIVIALLAFVFASVVHPTILCAQTVTINVGSVKGAAGQKVEVPISAKDATDIGAMHIEVAFDPTVLEAQDAEKGQLLSGNSLLESNTSEPGRVILGVVSLDGLKGDGIVATARFKVRGKSGAKSPLRLEKLEAWHVKTHQSFLTTAVDGEFSVAGLPFVVWLGIAGAILLILIVWIARRRRRQGTSEPGPA